MPRGCPNASVEFGERQRDTERRELHERIEA